MRTGSQQPRGLMRLASAMCFFVLPGLVGACASTPATLTGAMCPGRTVVFGEVGAVPRWRFEAGQGAVLVVFTADGEKANEELVLELPSAEPGELQLASLPQRYYQRGGQVLTYASRSLSGQVSLTRSGARMTGTAEVVATQPEVDAQGVGEVRRQLRFDVDVDPPMCR